MFLVLAAACSDAPTTPQLGTIRVSVETSGGDVDIDGYEFVVDTSRRYLTERETVDRPDGTRRVESAVAGLSPGTHVVKLEAVADNCSVIDTDSRSITLTGGQAATVAFAVVCVATGVSITTHTTGPDTTPTYDLVVDESSSIPVAPNATQIVSRLRPGAHRVSLQIRTENCSVVGTTQTAVAVTTRTITPVRFDIACVPLVRSEKIAYVVDSILNGKLQKWVAVVKPDGSGARPLLLGDSPSWSPSGNVLVFSTASCNASEEYYGVACKDGLVGIDPETLNPLVVGEGLSGFKPAWAPTGDVIAFTRCCAYADAKRLYLARVNGGQTLQLDVPGVLSARDPAWSPDGRRIAFSCLVNKSVDICVMNREAGEVIRLTDDDINQSDPAWSPDGSRIAFTQFKPVTGPEIVLVKPDGSGVTRLTAGFDVAWSRDGTTLVFGRADGLYTIRIDGSPATRLTTGNHHAPAWRP